MEKPPLENPVVLRHMFSMMKPVDLVQCRLVSKTWTECSAPYWYPCVVITVGHPLRDALQSLSNRTHAVKYPYRNLRLNRLNSFTPEELVLFQSSIGSTLTSLTLFHHKFENVENFRHIIYYSCPLLKKLKIDRCRLPKGDGRRSMPSPTTGALTLNSLELNFGTGRWPLDWEETFVHFRQLSSFVIGSIQTEDEISSILEAIRSLRATQPGILPLVHFQLHKPLLLSQEPASMARITLVKALRLPFATLVIKLTPTLEQSYVQELLSILASSLISIKITQPEPTMDAPEWIRELPCGVVMGKVKNLEIVGNLMSSLGFVLFFPNLKSLQLLRCEGDLILDRNRATGWTHIIRNTSEEALAALSSSSLSIFTLGFNLESKEFTQLLQSIPHRIQELAMPFDYSQFRMLCTSYNSLVKLRILGNRMSGNERKKIEEWAKAKECRENGRRPSPLDNLLVLEEFTYPVGQIKYGIRQTATSYWMKQ